MGLGSLALFMVGMWVLILAESAFLVVFVAPIDQYLFGGSASRLTISAVQAAIAIASVIVLVFGLNWMKRVYLQKKLRP